MEEIKGEIIQPNGRDLPQGNDSVAGMTIRETEIASVKLHAEELHKSVDGQTIRADMINRGSLPKEIEPAKPRVKLYIIYCEPCGFKRLTDGSDVAGLVPYKQSMIPTGSPYLDAATGQIKTPPAKQNSKKFKCPKCGRVVTVKKIADPDSRTGRNHDE